MTHPAYILVDAEGKVIAVRESKDKLKDLIAEYKRIFPRGLIKIVYNFPFLILPAEVKWEMPKKI